MNERFLALLDLTCDDDGLDPVPRRRGRCALPRAGGLRLGLPGDRDLAQGGARRVRAGRARYLAEGGLTHSLWFHQPLDASEWLRLDVTGQRLAGGRGFGTGHVYTEAGTLVASFAQESVIRRPRVPAQPGTRTATGDQQ